MITPSYVRTMVAYNAEINRRLYAAAWRLSDSERNADRGAFFKSIHGTLVHLLWGDLTWMSRFDGWPKPAMGAKDSPSMIDNFSQLSEQRVKADKDMQDWATRITHEWLDETVTWFSDALQREMRTPRWFLVAHPLNHQTHHRGQVHAMLTACREGTGDTDLFLVVEPAH
ncbi:MAG: DinB family protein [Acetobacteraceae bacterium]|nr:DinB family protein [Acetobacteraceae bacterium]